MHIVLHPVTSLAVATCRHQVQPLHTLYVELIHLYEDFTVKPAASYAFPTSAGGKGPGDSAGTDAVSIGD